MSPHLLYLQTELKPCLHWTLSRMPWVEDYIQLAIGIWICMSVVLSLALLHNKICLIRCLCQDKTDTFSLMVITVWWDDLLQYSLSSARGDWQVSACKSWDHCQHSSSWNWHPNLNIYTSILCWAHQPLYTDAMRVPPMCFLKYMEYVQNYWSTIIEYVQARFKVMHISESR